MTLEMISQIVALVLCLAGLVLAGFVFIPRIKRYQQNSNEDSNQ